MSDLFSALEKLTNAFGKLSYLETLLKDIKIQVYDHEKRLMKLESSTELNMSQMKNFFYEEFIKKSQVLNATPKRIEDNS
jgi:hypothetical protein